MMSHLSCLSTRSLTLHPSSLSLPTHRLTYYPFSPLQLLSSFMLHRAMMMITSNRAMMMNTSNLTYHPFSPLRLPFSFLLHRAMMMITSNQAMMIITYNLSLKRFSITISHKSAWHLLHSTTKILKFHSEIKLYRPRQKQRFRNSSGMMWLRCFKIDLVLVTVCG